jgi:hypothetical protein
MFNIGTVSAQKFLNASWIPVKTLSYNDGSPQWAVQITAVEGPTTPPGGLGFDPVNQLGAMYVMVGAKVQYSEGGKVSINNDFRKYGLILNPLAYSGVSPYSSLIGVMTTNLGISSITGTFNPDDTVTGATSHATAKVVDEVNGLLRLTQVSGTFQVGETLNDSTSGGTAGVGSITYPDIKANTGKFLYSEYIAPVTRASNQIENFQIVLPF